MLLARRGYFPHFSLQRFRLVASANFLCKEIRKNHRTYHVGVLEQCLEIRDSPDAKFEGENLKTELCENDEVSGGLFNLSTPAKELNVSDVLNDLSRCRNLSFYDKTKPFYVGRDSYREVLNISRELDKIVTLDDGSVANILQACIGVKVSFHFVQLLHAKIIRCGFSTTPHVCNPLIDLYLKNEYVDSAVHIFKSMRARDSVSWVVMISGLSRNCHELDSIQLYSEMRRSTTSCSNMQVGVLVRGLWFSMQGSVGKSIELFEKMQTESLKPDSVTVASLLGSCALMGDLHKGIQLHSYAIKAGFAQSGKHEEALKVFTHMTQAGEEEANMFTYGSAISAAANLAHVKLGKQIHGRTIQTGHHSETEVCNVLVTLYAKCGCLDDAKRVFVEMPQKNEISWNAMITGYSQHGYGRKAIELFEHMNMLELKPNHITYVGVLTACSHVGLVEEGLSYFRSMSEQHGLVPKQEHYACVVDILGRAGQLGRAEAFMQSMPIEPDAMIWRTFLSACTVHKNRDFGEVAAKHLLELEPNHSATYVLTSNMYAVTGEWDHRDHTRLLMRNRGVKKEAGRSWIEVKNSVHAFFVGDRLHPLADEIYNYLDELTEKVAAIGYVPDQNSLWNEVELRQKDPAAHFHSEKLAVAFGLLSLPSIIPLHVMKNLRVCNDCHNWIKFISKVVDRTIIVRDAYRFHHFQDGSCSCNDYW
ncbi:pentatricopeptide repeat-containing protein At4g13650 isoform X5 [Salvia miltiorrhiza]|uniref:pentatricopeptide repeat-containing protein At4g13650 isoform X5 n=1 Tax=Salvia miltiorrhiza TaxID=226208 RepID=UPI0025AC4B2E|nr:pentatricopeptide repeat-containing protein At4g13650 isoform X5 [Salvia miltiorrhiza]